MRLPRWLRSLERRYLDAYDTIVAETQAEPTTSALADEMDTTAEIVSEIRNLRGGRHVVSYDGDGTTAPLLLDIHVVSEGRSLDDRLEILTAVEELPENERFAVLGTYGAGLTQAEIGARLGLPQRQVSRILARALAKMGHSLRLAS